MCEPVSLTMAGIAAAGAAVSIVGQEAQNSAGKQVEKQKESAVEKQIIENRRRATADYIATVQDEQLAQAQEQEALTEQELDLGRTRRDASSKADVAAAESGVAGQSLALIHQDYAFQQEQAAGRLGISQAWRDHQHNRNIQAAESTYYNRASSVQPYQVQPVKPVDWFGPIFSAAGQSMDAGVRTGAFEGAIRKNPLTT